MTTENETTNETQNAAPETVTSTARPTGESQPAERNFSEQLEVAGNQLVEKVQDLVRQGNARRVIIRNAEDEVLLDINLTVGAVAGGVVALAMPVIAALAFIAGLVARVKLEIVRVEGE